MDLSKSQPPKLAAAGGKQFSESSLIYRSAPFATDTGPWTLSEDAEANCPRVVSHDIIVSLWNISSVSCWC